MIHETVHPLRARLRRALFVVGLALVAAGYALLAVPQEAAPPEAIQRAFLGMACALTGSGIALWSLMRR